MSEWIDAAQAAHILGVSRATLYAYVSTVGWLAHALEQGQSGSLIRPRAAYTGERPLGDDLAADASGVTRGRVIRAR